MNLPAKILYALCSCVGLSTVFMIVQARLRGERFELPHRPFYLGADAVQLAAFVCFVFGVATLAAPWFAAALVLGLMLTAWAWAWGFLCHPRRTRLGVRVDELLAPYLDPVPRSKGRSRGL